MPTQFTESSNEKSSSQLDAFHTKMRQRVESKQLPGMQYIISQAGNKIANQCIGHQSIEEKSPISSLSLFRLASATKVFVSVGFLRLVEKGNISLTTPIEAIFSEYKALNVLRQKGVTSAAKRKILMIDLLRHSCGYGYGEADYQDGVYRKALISAGLLGVDDSGMDHWNHPYDLREWAATLAKVGLEDEPGTRVSYGLGHDILGAVIEEVSGQSLDRFMQQEVFEPLGLSSTFFIVPQNRKQDLTCFYTAVNDKLKLVENADSCPFLHRPSSFSGGGGWDMLGNGGLTTNATDFVKLLEMIVNGGFHNQERFLKPEHAQQLCTSQSHALKHAAMLPGCEYSYGVADVIDPMTYRERGTSSSGPRGKMWWGGSTNTYFFYVPSTKRVGVFLTHTFPFGHKGALYQFGSLSEAN